MAKSKSDDLPEFVVDGQFEDHSWRETAAKKRRSDAEDKRVAAGPRAHPYGPQGYRDEGADGVVRWFADKAAAQKWRTANKPEEEADRRADPSPTEAGPEQARASRRGLDSAAAVQQHGGESGGRGRSGR